MLHHESWLDRFSKLAFEHEHWALTHSESDGGSEWESNPPETVSRPLPDLKSGHPTGDASLPNLRSLQKRFGVKKFGHSH